MLFNSFAFILLFLPIVLAVSWQLRSGRGRIVFWTLASWFFYASAGPWFLALMIGSTVLDFTLAKRIARSESPVARRGYMLTSICFGIGLLAFFKYFNFFLESAHGVAGVLHDLFGLPLPAMATSLSIVLPAGISFYTFETIRYTIDVYRREIEPENDFWYFACFVSLFPHLIAGPIIRPGDLLPQLHRVGREHQWRFQSGLFLFVCGLCKKVLIADRIALVIDPMLANPGQLSTPTMWLAMLGFAMQIYFDFSGYTDMARGLAQIMGFRLILNFNNPYLATGLGDFWGRWHISLSSWFRDYVYIPLGGNRGSELLTYRNLFITFLISGIWHGAAWTFAIWGILHALGVIGTRQLERSAFYRDRVPKILKQLTVFVFVCFTWIFFRAANLTDALLICRRIFTEAWTNPYIPALMLLLVALVWLYQFLCESPARELLKAAPIRVAIAVSMVIYICICSSGAGSFIYFQF